MTGKSDWQGRVGQTWADCWRETDRTFAPVTARLLAIAREDAFTNALDIGCGAGELACSLKARAPGATVAGVDVSHDLVEAARRRCPDAEFHLADASVFVPTGPRPDLLVSRHGVMFFPDPAAAFAHLAEIAAPRARLVFSCFRARSENAWVSELSAIAGAEAPIDAITSPGPFAFADRDAVGGLLLSSGWQDVQFEQVDYAMIAGEGDAAAAQASAYFQRIGPAASAIAAMDPVAAQVARGRLEAFLATRIASSPVGTPQVALGASVWIVTARAPA